MPVDTLPAMRRFDRTLHVTVTEVIVETPDTVTLVYGGPGAYEYRAGQFLTIDPHQFSALRPLVQQMERLKKRKEPPRAFSMASAPHEPLAITIKEETWAPGRDQYPVLLSPFLVRDVKAGLPMTIAGFTGSYCLPGNVERRVNHVVHLCAGSGSVPNWSIVKSALRDHPRLRHTFIYSNTTWNDIIYRDALTALAAAHPDRLRVVHTLTRQNDLTGLPPDVRTGRITAALVREVVPEYGNAIFYACGPALTPWQRLAAREKGVEPAPRFIEGIRAMVKELGVPTDRYRQECYG